MTNSVLAPLRDFEPRSVKGVSRVLRDVIKSQPLQSKAGYSQKATENRSGMQWVTG